MPFSKGDINKIVKYIDECFKKSSPPEPVSQFNQTRQKVFLKKGKGIQVCSNEGPCTFPRVDTVITLTIFENQWANFNQN